MKAAAIVLLLAALLVSGCGKKADPGAEWVAKAKSHVTQTIASGPNGKHIADKIQQITHPTGSAPFLKEYKVSNIAEMVWVRFNVEWQGGLTGTKYNTVVLWSLTEQKHVNASVESDSAAVPIAADSLKALDAFFRDDTYPLFKAGMK